MKTKAVNRSEKIREYLKSAKDTSPKAVSEALKEKGIKVSPNLVSLVKMKMVGKPKKAAKKATRKAVKPKARPKAENPHASFVLAKDFLNSAGGIDQAKKILDFLGDLMS